MRSIQFCLLLYSSVLLLFIFYVKFNFIPFYFPLHLCGRFPFLLYNIFIYSYSVLFAYAFLFCDFLEAGSFYGVSMVTVYTETCMVDAASRKAENLSHGDLLVYLVIGLISFIGVNLLCC